MTRSQAAAGRLDRLEIRPFRPTDLDHVIGLWQSCNLVRPWNSPSKDIARKLGVNPEWFLVATLARGRDRWVDHGWLRGSPRMDQLSGGCSPVPPRKNRHPAGGESGGNPSGCRLSENQFDGPARKQARAFTVFTKTSDSAKMLSSVMANASRMMSRDRSSHSRFRHRCRVRGRQILRGLNRVNRECFSSVTSVSSCLIKKSKSTR
jgi:hypothetical protein